MAKVKAVAVGVVLVNRDGWVKMQCYHKRRPSHLLRTTAAANLQDCKAGATGHCLSIRGPRRD